MNAKEFVYIVYGICLLVGWFDFVISPHTITGMSVVQGFDWLEILSVWVAFVWCAR